MSEEFYLFKCVHEKVPLCESNVYTEDKKQIGVIDEVLGPIHDIVSIKIQPYKKSFFP